MSKTMAEVLAEHQDVAWNHVTGQAICGGCDAELGPFTADIDEQNKWLLAHQAAALSAAGFGLVADAKAEALEEAAACLPTVVSPPSKHVRHADVSAWLRTAAAATRAAS